ncbi:hypothetical protein Pan216_38290 [Planctomycetes bacterium Pan216]|uniref:Carboxypeptidase regulatory-like domain-containing protein n=1 Tax=Kolteria novifilia TaxID=2527975 RepID=A0A518B7K7_9BACT|nr:hypothetical protein Pan216_38290 [Planctomycetes bacterium Pan216]
MKRRLSYVLGLALLLGGVGCGAKSDVKLGQVHGKVTLDGMPLSGALVSFYPEKGRPSTATSDAEGFYELQYTPKQPGALLGPHTVRITTAQVQGEGAGPAGMEIVPAKYNEQSELHVEVVPGSNEHDFKLQ